MKKWKEIRASIDSLDNDEKNELQNAAQLIASLVEKREEKGLSQKEIAIISGIKQPAISRMEKYGVMPRVDTFVKIAKAVGLEILLVDKTSTL